MFTLFLVAINLATVVAGLFNLGEKGDKPRSHNDKDDDDRTNIICS